MKAVYMYYVAVVVVVVQPMSLALECYHCSFYKVGQFSESGTECEVAFNVYFSIFPSFFYMTEFDLIVCQSNPKNKTVCKGENPFCYMFDLRYTYLGKYIGYLK